MATGDDLLVGGGLVAAAGPEERLEGGEQGASVVRELSLELDD